MSTKQIAERLMEVTILTVRKLGVTDEQIMEIFREKVSGEIDFEDREFINTDSST